MSSQKPSNQMGRGTSDRHLRRGFSHYMLPDEDAPLECDHKSSLRKSATVSFTAEGSGSTYSKRQGSCWWALEGVKHDV